MILQPPQQVPMVPNLVAPRLRKNGIIFSSKSYLILSQFVCLHENFTISSASISPPSFIVWRSFSNDPTHSISRIISANPSENYSFNWPNFASEIIRQNDKKSIFSEKITILSRTTLSKDSLITFQIVAQALVCQGWYVNPCLHRNRKHHNSK